MFGDQDPVYQERMVDTSADEQAAQATALEQVRLFGGELTPLPGTRREAEALAAMLGADATLLDNMTTSDMAGAVRRVRASARRIVTEASGNLTLDRLGEVAATGVDFMSVGALTHSATAADLSLNFSAGTQDR